MQFNSLKERCQYEYCNQICYLPLTCKHCTSKFCEKHKRVEDHECKAEQKDSVQIIKCPICLDVIKYNGSQNVNAIVSSHIQSKGCVKTGPEAHKAAKAKVLRCHAAKCVKKLNSMNKTQCQRCRQWHCLKHRFEDFHQCDPSSFFEGRGNRVGGLVETKA